MTTLLAMAIPEPRILLMMTGGFAVLALISAIVLSRKLKGYSPGDETMQRLAGAIRKGAMAFLRTEYIILFFFVIGLGAALTIFVDAGGWANFQWVLDNDHIQALLLGNEKLSVPDVAEPIGAARRSASFRARRRRHLHEGRGRRRGPGRQGRGGHPRGRPAQPGRDRRQRR